MQFDYPQGFCWGHEGDEPHCTVSTKLTGFTVLGLSDNSWWSIILPTKQSFFNHLVTVLWLSAQQIFLVASVALYWVKQCTTC